MTTLLANPETASTKTTGPASPEANLPAPDVRLGSSGNYLHNLCRDKIAKSEHYLRLTREEGVSRKEAFEIAAKTMADDPDAHLDRFERSMLHLGSKLGNFIEGNMLLDEYRGKKHLSQQERQHMMRLKLESIIPFNHEIKELINDFPRLKINDLTNNLHIAHAVIFSRYNPNDPEKSRQNHQMSSDETKYRFSSGIEGMRHEIAAETLLSAAGIDYDYRVSAEEDSTGNDLFVFIDGRWEGIDIKSSFNAERRAHTHRGTSRAVWTTLQPEEFRGPNDNSPGCVSASYVVAEQHALEFESRVYRAVNGELTKEHREEHREEHHSAEDHQRNGRVALQGYHVSS